MKLAGFGIAGRPNSFGATAAVAAGGGKGGESVLGLGGLFSCNESTTNNIIMPVGSLSSPTVAALPSLVSRQSSIRNPYSPPSAGHGLSLALTHVALEPAREPWRTISSGLDQTDSLAPPKPSKDEGYESRSGSDNLEDGSGDEQDPDHSRPSKKRYHRHSPAVIQELEAFFKECAHPDEKQRQELSRRLNLAARQVKFWFQNRRTQMKTHQERHENNLLRQENERLRAENFTIREAMRNASCPTCGGPTILEMSIEEQQIRLENARMREELEKIYALGGGRMYGGLRMPPPSLPAAPASSTMPLYTLGGGGGPPPPPAVDLQMNSSARCSGERSTTSIFHSRLSSSAGDLLLTNPMLAADHQSHLLTPLERSLITELAVVAAEEFVKMVNASHPLWVISNETGKETLDFNEYLHQFPRGIGPKPEGYRSEATRDVCVVMQGAQTVVDSFLDVKKWMELFPSIVCSGDVGEIISAGSPVSRNGALQLMYAELQVPSPLVPTRKLYFLRYCKTFGDGVWGIIDVSVDNLRGDSPSVANRYRRRPSGCLIQQLPNGLSKVSWVEHSEFDDSAYHHLYRQLVNSGMAFGAHRWVSSLKRQCQRQAIMMANSLNARASVPSEEASKMCLLKLAQTMTAQLCSSLSSSSTWTTLSGNSSGHEEVRVMTREYNSASSSSSGVSCNIANNPPGGGGASSSSSGIVLSAATSIWLPVSVERVFDFLTSSRREWDVLSVNGPMDELLNISTAQEPGNYVSLLKPTKSSGTTLIFQECCSDESGSSLVYAPVDIHSMDAAMSGAGADLSSSEHHPNLPTVPSGFIIMPDGPPATSTGSLVTVAFQIHVNSMLKSKLTLESIHTVNTLVCNTVNSIRKALVAVGAGVSEGGSAGDGGPSMYPSLAATREEINMLMH